MSRIAKEPVALPSALRPNLRRGSCLCLDQKAL